MEFFSKIVGYIIPFGQYHDPLGKEGLSNVLVDSYTFGTNRYPDSKSLFYALESTGAEFTASADKENIYIYVSAPKERIKEAEALLDEIVMNVNTSEDSLEKIRQLIKHKIEELKTDSVQYAFDLFSRISIPERPDLGTAASLDNIALADLLEAQERVKSSCIKYTISSSDNFSIDSKELLSKPGIFATDTSSNILYNDKKVDQKTIVYGHRTVGREAYGYGVRKVANAIMSRGLVGLTMEIIREQKAAAYFAGFGHLLESERGASYMYAGVSENNVVDVVETMQDIYRMGREGDFDERVLEEAKRYFIGRVYGVFDSLDSLAIVNMTFLKQGLSLPTIESIKEMVDSVSIEDVKKYFTEVSNRGQQYLVVNGVVSDEIKSKLSEIVND